MSDTYLREELAVVKSASFGLDDRTFSRLCLTLEVKLLHGEVTLNFLDEQMIGPLSGWKCTDIKTLKGKACVVQVTGPGSSAVRYVRTA